MTKKIFVLFSLIIYGAVLLAAHNYQVKSPDGRLLVTISTDKQITYSVKHDGLLMLLPSPISMQLIMDKFGGRRPK